jgi:uncharacterized membrane protein YgdD (TMEM256/DUF423 family)
MPDAASSPDADRRWRQIGALVAMVGVMAGAFGAHALKENPLVESWKTGAHYQLLHGIALTIPGLPPLARRLLLTGALLFAGSLYGLVALHLTWLGPVTPLGGVCMITGWGVVAWKARSAG